MALNDFLTSTEMSNGLTAPDRVKDLVGLMHKAADFDINNISDATRQWSAVASAVAATENKDCLILFAQLDGLIYVNKWLKDASEFVNKASDSFVEETVVDLLKALTRVEVVSDNLVGSGIWMTVENLLSHNNPKVCEMAKPLFEMWNKEKPMESVTEGEDIGIPEKPRESDIDATQGSLASESLKDEDIEKKSSNEDMSYSTKTEPVDDNLDKLELPVSCSEEPPSSEDCGVVGPEQGTLKEAIHGSDLDPSRTENLTPEMANSPEMFDNEQDPRGTLNSNDTGTLNSNDTGALNSNDTGSLNSNDTGTLSKEYEFSKQETRRKDESVEMKSDFDLDYGMADPLELARMVANEIEREVEDEEMSCSSSEERPERSHSITGELCQAESSTARVTTQPDLSDPPTREDHVTKVGQVVEASTDEGVCQFDLNEDICLEDAEHQGDTVSPPVSIVSASRAAAASSMPVGPLQFEGSLGWKGSATTSAFRPASPRKAPETDFAVSKENFGLLNFDLNVAQSGNVKQIPLSFRFDHSESSAEGSSRSERLEFDLNRVSDEGAPLHMQLSGLHSSSSSRQPSLINFDLNDQPTVANSKPLQSSVGSGSGRTDDSVISIMGRRVEVNRRDSSVQPIPFSNGRIPEPAIGFNLERPGGLLAMGPSTSYPHPQMHGFNGLPLGYSMPFSSPIYNSGGAIPYMVDSRGTPVVPQIMPSPTITSAFPQPPYLFSMPRMPSVNDGGLSRDNFDLNSGMYTEGSARDHGGFSQLFMPQPRPFDNHLMANSHPSTSSGIGVGGKRKEPENGWEPYPLKHHPQPWR